MKKPQLFLILGIVSVSLGGAMFIAGAVLTLMGNPNLGDLIMGLSSIFGLAALVFLVLRLYFMAKEPDAYPQYKPQQPKVIVKVVDVKEPPKSKEQELYEQYEDLYKRNLITKEELDAKRKDLLGK